MKKNDVASFLYYMWNAWCKSECEKVFPGALGEHMWGKWKTACMRHDGPNGAAETFFAGLSTNYQDDLVKRAIELYDRGKRIA
jgi:hypothetical protein